jgi:type IV secretory pathway TrbD component
MTESLLPLLDKFGGARRAMIIAVGVSSAALIFGLSRWATAPEWIPAYTGVPLELVGKMTDKLEPAARASSCSTSHRGE